MPAAPSTNLAIPRIRWGEILGTLARRLVQIEPLGEPAAAENPWARYWGGTYGPELKEWLLKPVFEKLELTGRLGNLIVDIGSGALPVTTFLPACAGRKRILVDIAADNGGSASEQRIQFDAERIAEPGALSYRKALVRARRFQGADAGAADTMVFSDLLNYVDFRKVLGGFANFLKPGGRMIVVNLPMRGNQALFSDQGLKDNRELYQFLEERGFEIESKTFPKRERNSVDEAEELIVLVARKRAS